MVKRTRRQRGGRWWPFSKQVHSEVPINSSQKTLNNKSRVSNFIPVYVETSGENSEPDRVTPMNNQKTVEKQQLFWSTPQSPVSTKCIGTISDGTCKTQKRQSSTVVPKQESSVTKFTVPQPQPQKFEAPPNILPSNSRVITTPITIRGGKRTKKARKTKKAKNQRKRQS